MNNVQSILTQMGSHVVIMEVSITVFNITLNMVPLKKGSCLILSKMEEDGSLRKCSAQQIFPWGAAKEPRASQLFHFLKVCPMSHWFSVFTPLRGSEDRAKTMSI